MRGAAQAGAALLLAACLAAGPSQAGPQGDAQRGRLVFQRCYACHAIDPADPMKLEGPLLHQVLGRRAGTVAGFEYSEAMRARGAAGLVWDAASIDALIADPEGFIPGTAMSAPPLRDGQERADVIAFLSRTGTAR